MKEELIAERKSLNEQIDKINARLREIHAVLAAIEKDEADKAWAAKVATATHTAIKTTSSLRGTTYSCDVYVRETPKGWRDVSDGVVYQKTNDPTKSKEKRSGDRFFVNYTHLHDIKKREEL